MEHRGPTTGRTTIRPSPSARISRAARTWLDALTPDLGRTAVWPFADEERGNWHYAPRARAGVPLRAMTEPQQAAAHALLAATLSEQGLAKARGIMALESVLADLERDRGRHVRDPLNYSFTVFGDPTTAPWGWRVEGHHLVLNVTVAGPDSSGGGAPLAVTPTFWGANPARVPSGAREGERVLAEEYHLGLEIARSLDATQRSTGVLADRTPGNIITERGRAGALDAPAGLPGRDLREGQRRVLTRLLEAYVGNVSTDVLGAYRAAVLDSLDRVHLGWAGGMSEGEPFYYRLHGPAVLIEFDCTQDDANHVHSVWRAPGHDWGRDVLGEHYREHHDDD